MSSEERVEGLGHGVRCADSAVSTASSAWSQDLHFALAMIHAGLRVPPSPYLSTCWMVQRLTFRSLASSRWLTPFDRSTLMYSRCCSVRLGRRPGKRPSVRAFAWPATERSLIEFRHHSLKASTIEIWSLPGYLIATDSSVASTPVNGGALQMEPPELSFAFLSTDPRQPYLPVGVN